MSSHEKPVTAIALLAVQRLRRHIERRVHRCWLVKILTTGNDDFVTATISRILPLLAAHRAYLLLGASSGFTDCTSYIYRTIHLFLFDLRSKSTVGLSHRLRFDLLSE